MSGNILAIDQGTTSSRAIVFDDRHEDRRASARWSSRSIFRGLGLGRARARGNLATSADLERSKEALRKRARHESLRRSPPSASPTSARPRSSSGTRKTGKAIHKAIVWQDRRTAPLCARLKQAGTSRHSPRRPDCCSIPIFSGTKIAWILDNVPGARKRAEKGELLAAPSIAS
jgi:glycerol kinase